MTASDDLIKAVRIYEQEVSKQRLKYDAMENSALKNRVDRDNLIGEVERLQGKKDEVSSEISDMKKQAIEEISSLKAKAQNDSAQAHSLLDQARKKYNEYESKDDELNRRLLELEELRNRVAQERALIQEKAEKLKELVS